MRVETVGTVQITPPLPEKLKPALAPGFSCYDTSPNTLFRIAGGAKN
jgi:hypothetical protein